MAHTYTSLHFHLVFSTKFRRRWIAPAMEERVWDYLGGIAKQNGMHPHRIGGVDDHIHAAVSLPPTLTVSKSVQLLKGGSSKWLHDTFPNLREFAWQDGYGAFSVSRSALPRVVNYIARQREHHARRTFQEEYLALLRKHDVRYDERYLWG